MDGKCQQKEVYGEKLEKKKKKKNKVEKFQLANLARPSQAKRKMVDENMKKYNEDDVNNFIMCKLRQNFVKLGNYVMRLMSVVLTQNN